MMYHLTQGNIFLLIYETLLILIWSMHQALIRLWCCTVFIIMIYFAQKSRTDQLFLISSTPLLYQDSFVDYSLVIFITLETILTKLKTIFLHPLCSIKKSLFRRQDHSHVHKIFTIKLFYIVVASVHTWYIKQKWFSFHSNNKRKNWE